MKARIVALANTALVAPLALGDNEGWGIGPGSAQTDSELLDAIDRGNYLAHSPDVSAAPQSIHRNRI